MKNFFTVILLVAVSIVVFIVYYTSKNFYARYRLNQIQNGIRKKRYEDEKKYIAVTIGLMPCPCAWISDWNRKDDGFMYETRHTKPKLQNEAAIKADLLIKIIEGENIDTEKLKL